MANYVWQKVICRKEVLDRYFIDPDPLGDGIQLEKPYITFNKLFGVKSLNEYSEKYGAEIYYGFGFSWEIQSDGLCVIKFCSRWDYPIKAIIQAITLEKDTVWYAVEENCIYVSKFYWSEAEGVQEDVLFLEADFENWSEANEDFDVSLPDPDYGVWYYLETASKDWKTWKSADGFSRYQDYAVAVVEFREFRGSDPDVAPRGSDPNSGGLTPMYQCIRT